MNSPFSSKYRNYILFILTGVYVFSFIDRQILVILQESIKNDLHLSDTQLGLLSGFSFAIFYVTFGIPIANFADKGNRRNIITLSLLLWSGMTALSGMAKNFIQLLLARVGVGVGEAGCNPSAYSIISDIYPPQKRATALAIYSTGISMGIMIGFLLGGWINQHLGWRSAFYAVGIPGILYTIVLYFTVKEPPRTSAEKDKLPEADHTMKDVLLILWRSKSFKYLALGGGMAAYVGYANSSWIPSFLARIHEMKSEDIGLWLSLAFGIGGGLGFFSGGFFSDKLGKKEKRWYLWLPALTLMSAIPIALIAYFVTNTIVCIVAIGLYTFSNAFFLAPCIALTHGIVGKRMRALASAILLFIINIVGLGCGPLFTGMISDLLKPTMGTESLRWALCTILLVSIMGSLLYIKAAKTIRIELNNT